VARSTPPLSAPTYGKADDARRGRRPHDRRAHDPAALVWTAWDLGIRDSTAIWFAQVVGREIRIIDYYEASGVDLGHYVREINAKPYVYAGHIVPHDAQARELGTARAGLEVLESLGMRNLAARAGGTDRGRHQCGAHVSAQSAGSTRKKCRAQGSTR